MDTSLNNKIWNRRSPPLLRPPKRPNEAQPGESESSLSPAVVEKRDAPDLGQSLRLFALFGLSISGASCASMPPPPEASIVQSTTNHQEPQVKRVDIQKPTAEAKSTLRSPQKGSRETPEERKSNESSQRHRYRSDGTVGIKVDKSTTVRTDGTVGIDVGNGTTVNSDGTVEIKLGNGTSIDSQGNVVFDF